VEGLFFFGAFAYVYFLRSRALLHGLAGGTNWVFRDESAHMAFAFEVVRTIRAEEPELFDDALTAHVGQMIDEAVGWPVFPSETSASTSNSAPTSAWRRWGSPSATAPATRSPFSSCKTSRR
jgi:ribonucleoside-diphosphate reductase beta chain